MQRTPIRRPCNAIVSVLVSTVTAQVQEDHLPEDHLPDLVPVDSESEDGSDAMSSTHGKTQ